jgi:L-Ala-D/L-Glu epimerase
MKLRPVAHTIAQKLEIPLTLPFHISKGSVLSLENVLVVVTDADGCKGLGEAAPFPVLTGDTQAIAFGAVREILDAISGLNPALALEKLHKQLWQNFRHAPTALTGVEMALWDLLAQQMLCPLSALWGRAGLSAAETDITLPCLPAEQVAEFWDHFRQAHFPYVKVKVGGGSLQDDLDRVMALRTCAGQHMRVSLDGNQGFTIESAKQLVNKLISKGIEPLFFEQPLAEADYNGMAQLSETLPVPVCADESVKTLSDAIRVINDKCAQMINLKFMKSGIRESLLIAEVAQRSHTGLMIGGMVESEIAMTASLHAVCATGAFRWCDLDTAFFLRRRITQSSPYHRGTALLELPEGVGLGLRLSEGVVLQDASILNVRV